MSEYLYLYGFVPFDGRTPEHITGVNDSVVEIIDLDDIAAAVSRVPADQYAPERLEPRLQDLQWVAEQGVAHERVVAWFVDESQILPAALFTMYSSVDALTQAARERHDALVAEMKRLRGQREWDIKVSFDERVVQQNAAQISENVAVLDKEIENAAAGKKYLLQKKRADLLKAEVRQAAHRRAVDVMNAVHAIVAGSRTLPLPRTNAELPVVLHAALLVRTENEKQLIDKLDAEARRLRAIGMDLSFSGPWAPYRFMGEHEQ